jgi:non-heme chloroperoxidase
MDHYADDLAELMNFLDLKNAIMVGHSTGGGEVARYIGRHGAGRVAKAVLISAVTPFMLKTDKNPLGLPMSAFDGIRAGIVANRSQFYQDLTLPFFGYNRPGAKTSKGTQDNFWLEGMLGSHKSQYDTVKAFSETDLTDDLKKIDIPVLVLHGEDDQIVPIDASARASAKILKNAKLKTYPGYPHGMPIIHADDINADILAFIKS